MTTSTAPALWPGVDINAGIPRVRKQFKGYPRVVEYFATVDEANARALDLDRRRRAGLPPYDADAGDSTLAEACAALLKRKRADGLTRRGIEHWERSLTPWRVGAFAELPLSLLRRATLEDALLERWASAPTAARNERQALLAALNYAGDRGASFDLAILRMPPLVVVPRERVALSTLELEWFAARVPPIGRRLVLLQGTVGNRVDELFGAEPGHVRPDGLYVPAGNCKERAEKTIPLTAEERELVDEQLGGLRVVGESSTAGLPAMPPGGPWLFMTAGERVYDTGKVVRTAKGPTRWRHAQFDRLVWAPAIRRAADDWRAEHGLGELEPTPFEWWVDPASAPVDGRRRDDDGRRWITTHDLRATAVTLMRDAGVARDACAARVGHADKGELVDAIYDKGSRSARAGKALAAAAPAGLRAKLRAA